jgi:uncharacterized damage-inducible protein DinB
MVDSKLPEPWLRGTLTDIAPVQRAVVHALELTKEDLRHWCGGLTDDVLNARPGGIAPLSFHLRHISRSLDRLLTYAEGGQLSEEQIAALKAEFDGGPVRTLLFTELDAAIETSTARIRAFTTDHLAEPRKVGKKGLPTTVAGLLVHIADHAQRHVGQAITTSKIIAAQRQGPGGTLSDV